MRIFNVLSFNPERIKLDRCGDGELVVRKKTSKIEHRQIIQAHSHLKKHPVSIGEKSASIEVQVVPFAEWIPAESTLVTNFCHGTNIEHVLRGILGKNLKMRWIALIRDLFLNLCKTGFLWGDCAPRNMIFEEAKNILWIVDFERPQILRDCGISKEMFGRYLRNYAREEFSCFLSKREQKILFSGLLADEYRQGYIPLSEITSKRKQELLFLLFKERGSYKIREVQEVENIMVSVATPFMVNRELFFPIDLLDQIGSLGGPKAYASIVNKIKRLKERERFRELNAFAETLG